jgi:hypothetical protein
MGFFFLNGTFMFPAALSLILAIVSYGIYLWRKKPHYIFAATMFTGYLVGLEIFFWAFGTFFDKFNYRYFIAIYPLISISLFLTYTIKYLRGRKSIDIRISGLGLGLALFYPISFLLMVGDGAWWEYL